MPIETSVVIPVYGSERILPQLIDKLQAVLESEYGDGHFEVVLVNDQSPDAAWRVIRELSATRPWLKAIALRKNAGQHNCILTGLRYASGKYLVMMDDDLQHDPADIPKIVARLKEGFDVCYTSFRSRRHPLWKRLGSKLNDKVASILLNKPRNLYLSPFKAIVSDIRHEIVNFHGPHVYVDGLILSCTNRISSVVLDHHERPDGKSGYGLRKSISLWLKMATSFSVTPLRLASLAGFLFSTVGFVGAILFVIQRFTINAMPVGWSSLIVSVLILGGIQLLALGVIGEYLGRVLLHVNQRPQAVVGEKINMDKDA
jgi:undecaprenyl-phosphate 4-deoxy-4-formamido-L-arabinose transferase